MAFRTSVKFWKKARIQEKSVFQCHWIINLKNHINPRYQRSIEIFNETSTLHRHRSSAGQDIS